MSKVDAKAVNIRDILEGKEKKYFIEDYQREYRWEEKHITDLIEDLTEKFLNSEGKDHYFLGSIIISSRDGKKFIIDGQQRLTSLTLLLIYIYRTLEDQALKKKIDELIYSEEEGFKLSVDLRRECMSALLRHGKFSEEQSDESIKNIAERYKNIKKDFLGHLAGELNTSSDERELVTEALPKFADWLIKEVYLVRITADSDADAFAIFETLNARGLSLTPTEMLKGYLLTNGPKDKEIRSDLNTKWKELINELQSIGNGGEDADAIKAWLRSQHAQDTRERKRNAPSRDFERIGTEFHRWVRDKVEENELQLIKETDFGDFISNDFRFYGKWYKFIRDAAEFDFARKNNVEAIHYNARNNFTLQRTVLLAPLKKTDNDNDIRRKLRIVSSFLDILIARRIWNYQSTAYSTMQYTMFSLIKKIRGQSIDDLKEILFGSLKEMEKTEDPEEPYDSEKPYESLKTFGLHSRNTPRVRYLLARMTDYVQTQSGGGSRYHEYITHEVEHIWANQYKDHDHQEEFKEQDFPAYRNRIGGLLLLLKNLNASYGALPYAKKRNYYLRENLLAQSLHEKTYDHNPGFVRFNDKFKRNSGLEFQPHPEFKKKDLDKRQELYRELCKQIWNPEKLRDM